MKKATALLAFFLLMFPPNAGAKLSGDEIAYSLYRVELSPTGNTNVLVVETIEYLNRGRPVVLSLRKNIPATGLENISVEDGSGAIPFTVRVQDNYTEISFTTGWIGTNAPYTVRISYVLTNWVKIAGGSYIVDFWGLKSFDFDCRQFLIKVLGPAGYMPFLSNPPATSEQVPPSFSYSASFSRGQSFSGFRAIFSKRAFYLVSLDYTITARNVERLNLDLILINPFVEWQFSSLASASPMPSEVFFDQDGNLHGVFKFEKPPENLKVSVQLFFDVQVFNPGVGAENVGSVSEVPPGLIDFTVPTDWWPCGDPAILQISSEFMQDYSNAYQLAHALMSFVENRLSYEQQEVRLGPLRALEGGSGDCSEYTDLFITLARACGLPARALYGWAHTSENFAPHAFAEVYLPRAGWLPVDPSWGDAQGDYFCRLDSSHVVRFVRGVDSSESCLSLKYTGGSAEICENYGAKILSQEEAARAYLSSARTHLAIARALNPENSELLARISEAELELSSAESASDFDGVVCHASRAVVLANEVIKLYRRERGFDWRIPVLLCAIFSAVSLLLVLTVFKEGRRTHRRRALKRYITVACIS